MSDTVTMREELRSFLHENPIIAVLVVDDPGQALSTGGALLAGGVRSVELALRTPRALDCIEALVNELPELTVIAGTVLTGDQVDEVARRGCRAAVAPGLNPRTVRHAMDAGLSFAPGVATPTDIEAALELGCRTLKFFPAEPSGGLSLLSSMAGPYAHLGLDFIPLGGIRDSHITSYLENQYVLALGGSWIAPRVLVESEEWQEIERRARGAVEIATQAR